MSILPIRKHRKCHSDICHREKTLITRYQASREPHDVTFAQLSIVVWIYQFPKHIIVLVKIVANAALINKYVMMIRVTDNI
jgi:hypothetical protein